MTSHQSEKPPSVLLNCPACEKRHVDSGEWATRPHHTHLCLLCGHKWRVEPYGFGAPEKPPSGVEVLQQWKARHHLDQFVQDDGRRKWCRCGALWPCDATRPVEQIEADRAAMQLALAYFEVCVESCDDEEIPEAVALREALTLSKLRAR